MSADKRSVKTDALETLGMLITENEKRDAIHLAVDNAVAGHTLRPGDDVGFLDDGTVGICGNPIGIVDPFLKTAVAKGQRFWLVVYPRQVTSLRHVWTHPAFPDEVPSVSETPNQKRRSELWLRQFALKENISFIELMGAASLTCGQDTGWTPVALYRTLDVPDEFWCYFEAFTGVVLDACHQSSSLLCSC